MEASSGGVGWDHSAVRSFRGRSGGLRGTSYRSCDALILSRGTQWTVVMFADTNETFGLAGKSPGRAAAFRTGQQLISRLALIRASGLSGPPSPIPCDPRHFDQLRGIRSGQTDNG
jgi:hypothetical protein